MTKITAVRTDIHTESLDYRSAISENLLISLGQAIQFINDFQYSTLDFRMLGTFETIVGGEDGTQVLPMDCEIVGYSGALRLAPSSSSLTVDVHKISTSGSDSGSVLSSNLTITSSAGDGKVFFKNQLAGTDNTPTGYTLPTINTTAISAGEGLRVDIGCSLSQGCADLSFTVWYRPT